MMFRAEAGKPRLAIAALLAFGLIAACRGGADLQRPDPIVFVLAGQSNMVGQGRVNELAAGQKALPSSVSLFVGTEEIVPAERSRFGPELTFAQELAEAAPEQEFVLVKYAIGATSLLDWAPEWDAATASITGNAERGPLYQQLISIIEELALADANFGAVLWMQGERDSRIEAAGSSSLLSVASSSRCRSGA